LGMGGGWLWVVWIWGVGCLGGRGWVCSWWWDGGGIFSVLMLFVRGMGGEGWGWVLGGEVLLRSWWRVGGMVVVSLGGGWGWGVGWVWSGGWVSWRGVGWWGFGGGWGGCAGWGDEVW